MPKYVHLVMANLGISLLCLQLVLMGVTSFKYIIENGYFKIYLPFGEGDVHLTYHKKMKKTMVGNATIYTTGEGCFLNVTSSYQTRNVWTPCDIIEGQLCQKFYQFAPMREIFIKFFSNFPEECPWPPNNNLSIIGDLSDVDSSFVRDSVPKTVTGLKGDLLVTCDGKKAVTGFLELSIDHTDRLRRRKPKRT